MGAGAPAEAKDRIAIDDYANVMVYVAGGCYVNVIWDVWRGEGGVKGGCMTNSIWRNTGKEIVESNGRYMIT